MKKIKIKSSLSDITNFIFKHISIMTLVLALLIIVGLGCFLYFNFYLTLTSAKQINILEENLASETLDLKMLDEVEKKLNNKINLPEFDWAELFDDYQESIKTPDKINGMDIINKNNVNEEHIPDLPPEDSPNDLPQPKLGL